MRGRTAAPALTYGFAAEADVRAEDVVAAPGPGCASRWSRPRGGSGPPLRLWDATASTMGWPPRPWGSPPAGLDLIAAGLGRGWQAPHRDQVVRAGSLTIVDDSYNASPASMIAALELLATLPGRHVAVLGEMRELGEAHDRGHREVGASAAGLADVVVVVGEGAAGIAAGAAPAGRGGRGCARSRRALAVLREILRPGDAVLVKASRGAELELIVESLAADRGVGVDGVAAGSSQAASSGAVEDDR